jgi:hypothetical protein
VPGENEAPPPPPEPGAKLRRAFGAARALALADMGLAGIWGGAGVVLRLAGFPWSSEQFMAFWFPVLALAALAGLALLFWSGVQIDKFRAARSPAIAGALRRATLGGVVAGLASLGVLWPRIVELSLERGAPAISGSGETDLAAGVAFGLVPLLLGVANGFAAMAFGPQFRELEA